MASRPGLGSEIFSFKIGDLAKNTDSEHTNQCRICTVGMFKYKEVRICVARWQNKRGRIIRSDLTLRFYCTKTF